jgi:L-lactate dehydrogenase complex protein LldG
MEKIAENWFKYKDNLYEALDNEFIRIALRRAIKAFRTNRDKAIQRYPEVEEKRKKLKEAKEYALTHLNDMIKMTIESFEAMKGHAYYAKTVNDALKILDEIIGSGKLIVKSKSITSEELDLNEHLEKQGNTIYETDLGEFIIQNLGSKPMHILSPAIHVPKEKVAELFSKIVNKKLPPNIELLVSVARKLLREKFFKADIGISGANAVSANTGSIFVIENEGNARFVTNAPPTYIALTGIEKIVPTLMDGMLLVEVVSRYASYYAPSFVSIISGPSKTGDIEKVPVYGVHGPKEVHLILLDNGRSEVAKDPIFRQALYCIRCGACLYECPVYALTAGHYGYKYFGGIGAIWTAFIAGGLEKAAPIAYTCTLCGRCVKACPMEIDVPKMILKLRTMLSRKGYVPNYVKTMIQNVLTTGIPY